LYIVENGELDLAVETCVTQIKVNPGETSDPKRDPRQAYLDIESIIE
jgi:hypothetical protein